jgi:sporulation protein YlmC with PRC-barrel domain
MATNKIMNEYDEIKGLLNKVRKIQAIGKANKDYGLIQEQTYQGEDTNNEDPKDSRGELTAPYGYGAGAKKPIPRSVGTDVSSEKESEDIAVINDVDIEIHSEDPEDLILQDDEKKKISQLIDDFRTEVSEIAELDALHLYPNSAVINGLITDMGLNFTFSTGDDTGLYIGGSKLIKVEDELLSVINKLKTFQLKFANTINDLLLNRSTT